MYGNPSRAISRTRRQTRASDREQKGIFQHLKKKSWAGVQNQQITSHGVTLAGVFVYFLNNYKHMTAPPRWGASELTAKWYRLRNSFFTQAGKDGKKRKKRARDDAAPDSVARRKEHQHAAPKTTHR
jgi:hypothetical protein